MIRLLRPPRLDGLKILPSKQGSHRSVFFTRLGIAAVVGVALAGIISGTPALTWIGVIVLVTAGVGAIWNRFALERVEWSVTMSSERLFPGDQFELALTIFNNKVLPLPSVAIESELSATLEPLDRPLQTTVGTRRLIRVQTRLGPYERVTWRIPVRCTTRGIHQVGPSLARATDPLGLFATKRDFDARRDVIVYPRVHPMLGVDLPVHSVSGEHRMPKQLITDPLRVIGIRDYRPEDPMKSIHWKASARQGRLQVRVTEPTTTLQFMIFANIDTFNHYWEGLDVGLSERVIEIAASLAIAALDRRWSVGLSVNGIIANYDQPLRVGIGRGPEQRLKLLDGMARLSPYSSTGFAKLLASGARRLPPRCTICIVTSLIVDGLLPELAALMAAGHRVLFIPVGECPIPALRGLLVRSERSLFGNPLETLDVTEAHG